MVSEKRTFLSSGGKWRPLKGKSYNLLQGEVTISFLNFTMSFEYDSSLGGQSDLPASAVFSNSFCLKYFRVACPETHQEEKLSYSGYIIQKLSSIYTLKFLNLYPDNFH
jgi:hypothetical protein